MTEPTPYAEDDRGVEDLRTEMAWQLRLAIHRAKITQRELAERTGLTQKHISQLVTNQADGSFAVWDDLAQALGLRWRIALIDGDVSG